MSRWATVADALRKAIRDPLEAERKVGALYGRVFRAAEEAYDRRGSRGRQKWT